MSELSSLSPKAVWYYFDLICSIPHISKHESRLAQALGDEAKAAGLEVICDESGNLIIKRPASPMLGTSCQTPKRDCTIAIPFWCLVTRTRIELVLPP